MRHVLVLGIEHLMTGVHLDSQSPLTFERESASMVRVISYSTIVSTWPVNGAWLESTEQDITPTSYGAGNAEWYAQVMSKAMQAKDTPLTPYPDMPECVIRAMRNRFGAQAGQYITALVDHGDYYGFHYANMFIGVEKRDGHMHS